MKSVLGAVVIVLLSAHGGVAPVPRVPVLVELFTSEGCSSCPPADTLLAKLQHDQPVGAAEIIPIGLHVDYWDRLGWRDVYSSAANTARQQGYSRVFGEDKVYTPQLVVDGQQELVGSDGEGALKAIEAATGRPHLPVHVTSRAVAGTIRFVIDLPAAPAGAEKIEVLAAVTESGLTSVVKSGENKGRTLQHVAVARKIQGLGALGGDAFVAEGQWKLESGWGQTGLAAVVWLQGAKTRHVYGAATAPVVR